MLDRTKIVDAIVDAVAAHTEAGNDAFFALFEALARLTLGRREQRVQLLAAALAGATQGNEAAARKAVSDALRARGGS